MPTEKDLWTEVGNKCLRRASELLDDKTAPAAATAETVKVLVETAISMDMLNLHWAAQSRSTSSSVTARDSLFDKDAMSVAQTVCKTFSERFSRKTVVCAARHYIAAHDSACDTKPVDFGSVCVNCEMWPECNGDWLKAAAPLFDAAGIQPQIIRTPAPELP